MSIIGNISAADTVARAAAAAATATLQDATNNVLLFKGGGVDDTVDFINAIAALDEGVPLWIDLCKSTVALTQMVLIPKEKWVSIRNGKISYVDAKLVNGDYQPTTQGVGWGNWSANYYGVLSFGQSSAWAAAVPAAPSTYWTTLGAVNFYRGQSSVTNATIASAITAALAAEPNALAIYLDIGSTTTNPNETGSNYGQRVSVSHVDGTIVYFSEPLQDDILGTTWFRVTIFEYCHTLRDLQIECADTAIDYSDLYNPRFGCFHSALAFNGVLFDVVGMDVLDLGVATMVGSSGRFDRINAVSYSKEAMDGYGDALDAYDPGEEDPPYVVNNIGTVGFYPRDFCSNITFANSQLVGYRHATDPASAHSTLSNIVLDNVNVKGAWQAAINSHNGGQLHIRGCEVHTPPGTIHSAFGGADQPYSVLLRSNGSSIDGLRIFHDKANPSGSAFAISVDGYNTDINNVYIETTNAGIACAASTAGAKTKIRNVTGKFVYDSSSVKYKFDGASYPEYSGSPLIFASTNSIVDVDSVVGDGFAVVCQQSGTGLLVPGSNITGKNLTTRNSTTAAYNGNAGAVFADMTASEPFRCLVSQGWNSNGAKGLCVPLLNMPSVDATSFTICFRKQFWSKQRQQNFFSLRTGSTNLIQIWQNNTDTTLSVTFNSGGTVNTYNHSALVDDGLWHHVALCCAYTGPNAVTKLYTDGTLRDTSSSFAIGTLTHDTGTNLFRGDPASAEAQAFGPLRDFRVYLTDQSANIAAIVADTFTTAPAFWLPCDEGHGNAVRDRISGINQVFSSTATTMRGNWGEY